MLLVLIVYSVLILLASLVGGWIPFWVKLTHRRMEFAISFVAGMMLGVGVFHLMPHAFHEVGSIDFVARWMVAGLVVMFLVERFFRFHRSTTVDPDGTPTCEVHAHAHTHGHGHAHGDDAPPEMNWAGAFVGLTVHTLLAGVALAASVASESAHGVAVAGFGAFLVIFLHKPLDSLTIGTLMAKGRWSAKSRHIVNAAFALVIPAGIGLFFVGLGVGADNATIIGAALAFSAGTFLCIALADLMPELQFHSHDRGKLTFTLLLGLAAAYAIGFFEHAGHDHHQEPDAGGATHGGHSHEHNDPTHTHGSGRAHDPKD